MRGISDTSDYICYRHTKSRASETTRKADKARYYKNKRVFLGRMRSYRLRTRYGITPDEYIALQKQQEGRCKICNRKPIGKLYVDHCHQSRKVRGLLCQKCNSGLGFFNDDISLVIKAVDYLTPA